MTDPMLGCEETDELAGAYALGAVERDEERAIHAHLAGCDRPHAEVRSLVVAAAIVPASLDAVDPSPRLRARVMASAAATPQDHRRIEQPMSPAVTGDRRWWRFASLPGAVAALALAAAIGLGVWGASLNRQVAERDSALAALAAADVIHSGSGAAGRGWLVERDGEATFVAAAFTPVPSDRLYELWLIDPGGSPTAVGTFAPDSGVASVTLERPLGDATTFAITLESERVEAPTTDPVFVAELQS
jgi:anti-sigma-K factor RskA